MTTKTVAKPATRKRVVNGATKPSAEIVEVDANKARLWLGKNVSNRKLRESKVNTLARDMAAGHWQFTGEAIKFDTLGRLVDGQHRLTALLRFSKPLPMLVVRGVAPRAQDVMDTGARRSSSDMFALNGKQNTALLAATARLAINWEAGNIRTSGSSLALDPTHSELKAFVDQNPDIEWAAAVGQTFVTSIPARPSVIAFSLWLTAKVDAVEARRFFASLAEMTTEGPGDPRYALMRRLQALRDERTTQVGQAFYFIKAWNFHREGAKVARLVAGSHGDASQFPVPV